MLGDNNTLRIIRVMRNKVICIAIIGLLTGCSSPSYNHSSFVEMAKRGDCNGASQVLTRGISAGSTTAIANMGFLHEYCYRNTSRAIGYYNLAARKGIAYAQTQLARLGQTVPKTDLKAKEETGDSYNSSGNNTVQCVRFGSIGFNKKIETFSGAYCPIGWLKN